MADVFLSYARSDREWAERLAAALEERGWSVWWDRRIPAGKEYDDVIEEALEEASSVVVLWSQRSARSRWVRAEAAEGDRRRVLVPALIEATKIPLEFRRLQTLDLVNWDGKEITPELEELVSAVRTHAGGASSGAPDSGDSPPADLQQGEGAIEAAAASSAMGEMAGGTPAAPHASSSPPAPPPLPRLRKSWLDLASGRLERVDRRTWGWTGQGSGHLVQAAERCVSALGALGVTDTTVETKPRGKVVSGTTGFGWRSAGELIRIELQPSGAAGLLDLRISSQSRIGTTILDWGKNRSNIEKLLALLHAAQ